MLTFLANPLGKILAAAVVIILILSFLQVRSCHQARQQAAQSRVDKGQSGAFLNSAADAIETQAGVNANDQAAADLSRRNREEITNAEGSDQRVSDASTAAGRNSLCRRRAYRDRPECRVREPDSR